MKTLTTTCFFLTFLLSQSALFAQNDPARIMVEPISGPAPWSSLEVNNSPETFQFAIVTDRTGGLRPGIFPKGIQKLNLLQPEFVMSVGDLIDGYTTDMTEINRQWDEFNGFIDDLTVPFFYVPGNHDYTNEVLAEKWESLFGKSYYHFTYKDVLFLCLNSEDNVRGAGKGTIDDEQYTYIEKTLAENADAKWTLVFMHQPLWNQQDTKRWKDVETLLNNRKHTVFVGHNHRYVKYERNNGKYFILGTTGGGSRLRGPQFGEFDHVVWVTMTDDGPIMANLMLDGIWSEDVVTEEISEYMRPLLQNNAVTIAPLQVEEENFSQQKTELKLTNDTNVPMQVDLSFKANLNLLPNFVDKQITVNPNSVEIIDLNIKALDDTPLDDLSPLKLEGKITYLSEGQPEISLPVQYNILPEKAEQIAPAKGAINIDGNLDEWAQLPFEVDEKNIDADPFSHKGSADASLAFDVAYDNDFLYIAAQVTDDEIIVHEGTVPYQQDGINIILDARPEKISALQTGDRLFRETLYIGQSPVSDEENAGLYRKDQLPEGIRAVCKKTPDGYVTEVAIPVSYLNKMQGTDWQNIRLNVAVSDYDKEGNHQTQIFWKPDWRGDDNYVGSGMFQKGQNL